MAKIAKIKKKQSTIHSRAARRAVSPSDPSLTKPSKSTRPTSASPPPHPALIKPHVLAAQNAGITKRSKSKPIKRAQRLRQLKGMEKAEENMDKLALKRAKSVGKEKKVRERAKGWDEVNESKKKRKGGNAFEALEEEHEKRKEREWVSDEEMDDNLDGEDGVPLAVAGEVKQLDVVVPESVPLPVATEEEDELL